MLRNLKIIKSIVKSGYLDYIKARAQDPGHTMFVLGVFILIPLVLLFFLNHSKAEFYIATGEYGFWFGLGLLLVVVGRTIEYSCRSVKQIPYHHLDFLAETMRADPTPAERRLAQALAANFPGYHWSRQVVIYSSIVDFLEWRLKLVIEVDGGHHGEPRQRQHDRMRSFTLRLHGYRVIRFWNNEVLENLQGVCEVIQREISKYDN